MSERKRDYPSGAEKRKIKQKRDEVIKKVNKKNWKGKYYPTHLLGARSDKQGNLLISVCPSVRHKKLSPPSIFTIILFLGFRALIKKNKILILTYL